MLDNKNFIAKRVAKELHDGDVVNLGIGLPQLVPNYLAPGIDVMFEVENGILGGGAKAAPGEEDVYVYDAGAEYITVVPGAKFFNSAESFGYIRGGHVDATVLGALQVGMNGDLANWVVPGKRVTGMGGAMDLVACAKHVIVAMEHTQKGAPKILKQCTFPLTGHGVVNKIITEMCVIDVTPEGLLMTEINPTYTVEQVQAATDAPLMIAENLIQMDLD